MGNKINHSLCGIITLLMLMASAETQDKVLEESSPPSSPQEAGARLQHSSRPVDDPGPIKCTQQGCLRCERVGCVKCKGVIVFGTRECLEECPSSHREDWSTLVDYMGRLCTESTSSGWLGGSTAGLGGRGLAVLVGAASGVAICLLLLLAGCAWVAYSRGKARRAPTSSPMDICSVYDEALVGNRARADHWLSPQELQERREFAKQVAVLRPDAPVFLAMLNDTRRKVRQLYRPNGTDSRSKAYRTVLRDLSRLLTLLNRPEGRLGAPPQDWAKLQAWAERSLRRYKKSCGGSSGGGSGVGSACSSGAASSASSTPSSSHALNQHQLPPEVHQTHSILQLPLPPDCGLRDPRHGDGIEVPALLQTSEQWSQSALANGYYYDSFYPLGLRPQDEITTEL